MKALGDSLFAATPAADAANVRVAYRRVAAADLNLPESWFRDAIFENPEVVIGACREAGRLREDERWFSWGKELSFDAGPVDVLLLSSRGRPAIVETKLSYNPERRREVVAQILDYALSLQDVPFDELPPIPAHPDAPDAADLQDCLAKGQFLLIVAGDALDPRAVRLADAVLANHLTTEWDLAMVDLNLYRTGGKGNELLLVPELRGTVLSQTRQVVRVQVEGATGRPRVVVDHLAPERGSDRRPKLASTEEFLRVIREEAPDAEAGIRRIVERFGQIQQETSGRFSLGLQSSTANLYWQPGSGIPRRIFALNDSGRLKVWLRYVLKEEQQDAAAVIRRLAAPVVRILPEETSGAVDVADANTDAILHVVTEIVHELDSLPHTRISASV